MKGGVSFSKGEGMKLKYCYVKKEIMKREEFACVYIYIYVYIIA